MGDQCRKCGRLGDEGVVIATSSIAPTPLCGSCFATGSDRHGGDHDILPGGLKVVFDPKPVLKMRMAPFDVGCRDDCGEMVFVTAHLTDSETAEIAKYVDAAKDAPDYGLGYLVRTKEDLVIDAFSGWLLFTAHVPAQIVRGEKVDLSVTTMGNYVQVHTFLTYAGRNNQPHAGEAERFRSLLASGFCADSDTFLRDQRDVNLRGKFA